MPMDAISRQNVSPMHQTSINGVDDMANLADLHDSAILHNLHIRFKVDIIYVSTFNPQVCSLSLLQAKFSTCTCSIKSSFYLFAKQTKTATMTVNNNNLFLYVQGNDGESLKKYVLPSLFIISPCSDKTKSILNNF